MNFADVALGGSVKVRDLWSRSTVDAQPGTPGAQPFTGSYTVEVPAHGVAMLGLTGTDQVAGADLGGTASASPALVRVDDTHATAFVRDASGALAVNTAPVRRGDALDLARRPGRRPDPRPAGGVRLRRRAARRLRPRHRQRRLAAQLRGRHGGDRGAASVAR